MPERVEPAHQRAPRDAEELGSARLVSGRLLERGVELRTGQRARRIARLTVCRRLARRPT